MYERREAVWKSKSGTPENEKKLFILHRVLRIHESHFVMPANKQTVKQSSYEVMSVPEVQDLLGCNPVVSKNLPRSLRLDIKVV